MMCMDIPEKKLMKGFSHNVIGVVFQFMTPREIIRTSLICKSVAEAVQMDHIWRIISMKAWSFVRRRFDETWKQTFKRKSMSMKGMHEGSSSQFVMVPLRNHKSYVTAIQSDENLIVSGDNAGEVDCWFEDESKYNDDDNSDVFTPLPISQLGKPIRSILIHDSKTYISALVGDNTIQVWEYRQDEKVVTPLRTIPSDCPIIGAIIQYKNNVVAVTGTTTSAYINIYSCETGASIGKIPYRLPAVLIVPVQIIGQFHLAYFNNLSQTEALQERVAVWSDYIWLAHPSLAPPGAAGEKYLIEKWPATGKKCVCSVEIPEAVFGIKACGATLFAFSSMKLYVIEENSGKLIQTLPLLTALNPTVLMSVTSNGFNYTIHFTMKHPFDLQTYFYNAITRTLGKSGVTFGQQHKERINSVFSNETNLATASEDLSIAIWDLATGRHLYRLLGGSKIVKVKSFVEHPVNKGFSIVRICESRVIGVIGNWIRVYAFDVKK